MNSAFRDLLASRIDGALAEGRAASGLTHAGTKGALREALIRNVLRPFLPPDIGIGHGQVASWSGGLSPEQDIVLFDRRILPPLTYEQELGLFPIEGVLATVEVKSCLTATTLLQAHDSAKQLTELKYLVGAPLRAGEEPSTIEAAIPMLFAFETDLAIDSKAEPDRYRSVYGSEEQPALRAICVAGRGFWVWDGSKEWTPAARLRRHDEIIAFLIGLLASFERVSARRGRPDLRQYVFG